MNVSRTIFARFAAGTSGLIVASGLCVLLLSGCSGFGGTSAGWMSPPWSRKPEKPERRVAIKAPYERMADLAELAKNAPSMSPQQQQETARSVAAEFRGEGDPLLRAQMVRVLEKLKTPEAAGVLREAMEDSSIDVRIAACQAWGARGGSEAGELLGERVGSDTNVDVRLAAARALGETKEQTAVPKLAVALEDTDPALQYRAVLSLQKITGKRLDNDVNQWRQFVKGETPTPPKPVSLAERMRQMF